MLFSGCLAIYKSVGIGLAVRNMRTGSPTGRTRRTPSISIEIDNSFDYRVTRTCPLSSFPFLKVSTITKGFQRYPETADGFDKIVDDIIYEFKDLDD